MTHSYVYVNVTAIVIMIDEVQIYKVIICPFRRRWDGYILLLTASVMFQTASLDLFFKIVMLFTVAMMIKVSTFNGVETTFQPKPGVSFLSHTKTMFRLV